MDTTLIYNNEETIIPQAKLANTIIIFRDISPSISSSHQLIGQAITSYLEQIRKLNNQDSEVETKVLLINFSEKLSCVNTQPLLPQELLQIYEETPALGHTTALSIVYKEMDRLLSRKEIIQENVGALLPTIIFITDHQATYDPDYQKEYQNLKNNNWFKRVLKIAVSINNAEDSLTDFTLNKNMVLNLQTTDITKNLSKFLVTATAIAGKTHIENKEDNVSAEIDNLKKNNSDEDIIQEIIAILDEDD